MLPTFRLLSVIAGLFASSLAAADRPNIVFFMVDDQKRAEFNHLPEGRDAQGRPRTLTPNLDRLVREGAVLDRLHVPTPICIPSRFTVLTGLYPNRATNPSHLEGISAEGIHNVYQSTKIMPDTPSLPKYLRDAGYFTGAVGKNHVIEEGEEWRRPPLDADSRSESVRARLARNHEILVRAYQGAGFEFADRFVNGNLNTAAPRDLHHHNLEWMVEGAFEFIAQAGDRPFFLYFASTLPHGPNASGTGWRTNDPLATSEGFLAQTPAVSPDMPARDTIPARLAAAGLPEDAGDMLWIDDALGALLTRLEKLGKLENTIVVYMNDHGMEAGKFSPYQRGLVTPVIVRAPGRVREGVRIPDLASSADLAPTLLEFAGVDLSPLPFEGMSLVPTLSNGAKHRRDAVYSAYGYSRAVRAGDWKYIAVRLPLEKQNLTLREREASVAEFDNFKRWAGQASSNDANLASPLTHEGRLYSVIIQMAGAEAGRNYDLWPHYLDADQLYNLATDPDEQVNLARDPAHAATLAHMKALLAREAQRLPGTFMEFTPAATGITAAP